MRKLMPLCLLLLAVAPLRAEDTAVAKLTGGLKTWFEHLKEGLTDSSVSGDRQHGSVTAVAAVRGAEQSAPELDKPALKSSKQAKRAEALKKERAELAAATDLALQGDLVGSDKQLLAFEKAHPKSPYVKQAREARAKIKEASAPAAH